MQPHDTTFICAYCEQCYTLKYQNRLTMFCSRTCACKSRAKEIAPLMCAYCGTLFTPASRRADTDHAFCSTVCARKSRTKPPEERFWKYVQQNEYGCWLWIGGRQGDGYGTFGAGRIDGTMLAHRFSYRLHYGNLPDTEICHTCDNPPCVRPDHLFAGTHTENMHDAVRKGHIGNGMSLILAREIRSLHGTIPNADIATRYGISKSLIWFIVNNWIWKEL